MGTTAEVSGPDFNRGVSIDLVRDGETLLGHVGDKAILLSKIGENFYAVGARCSHYGAPLNDGLVTGDTVHCPWHHAVFSLKTGEALKGPALSPISCWSCEVRDGKVYVSGKHKMLVAPLKETKAKHFIIIGAGAAGVAAAVMLRRKGFIGALDVISEDEELPYDRTNLSKDFLAGNAPEEWLPLFSKKYYEMHQIDMNLGVKVQKIDPRRKAVFLSDGRTLKYDSCLLATGGHPVYPDIPGIGLSHVFTLRSLRDCRQILARTTWAQKVVIIGAGFIGLEVAASLRERNLDVHVVAPEEAPLMGVVGVHVSSVIKKIHKKHGVHFHFGHTVAEIRERSVVLDDGTSLDCDFVIVGVGIRPNTLLAEQIGCKLDKGVVVNEYLQTSVPDVFAAGDLARWPDPHSKRSIRVEHWEVAERQGQVAALNMLGGNVKFQEVPFFWSQHYDLSFGYIGHSEGFDRMEVLGDMNSKDFAVVYYEEDRVAALLTVGRDRESLLVEEALSHFNDKKVHGILVEYERRLHSQGRSADNFFEPSP